MENMLSPADVAVLSGNAGNNGNSGFGNNGDWAWIIVLFLIFGWGRNGYGNGGFGGNGGGAVDGYVLATDFATIERKLDSIANGICDSTFALNNTINTGFFGVQNALCQGFSGINQGLVTQGYETRNAITDLGYRLQDCCCQTQRAIDKCCCETQSGLKDISYNIAMGNNAITTALCNNTRDIIENQNANYRALHEELVANKLEMKNDRIAELTSQVNKLQLAASQERQSNYLLSELKPCPSAAYIVPNPNCCYDYTVTRNTCCNNGIY